MLGISAKGAVTISGNFGPFLSSNSTPLPDGTLIAFIVDANNNGILPGLLTENSSLVTEDGSSIQSAFAGITITTGSISDGTAAIGDDYIFYTTSVNGSAGFGFPGVLSYNSGSIDTTSIPSNAIFGVYWFTGLTTASNTVATSGFEVGGLNETTNVDPGSSPMRLPKDGTIPISASTSDLGGTLPASRFLAVDAIPEPSTALLGLLGTTGLFFRRRR